MVDPALVQPRTPIDVGTEKPVLENEGKTMKVIAAIGEVEEGKVREKDPVKRVREEGQGIADGVPTKKMTEGTIRQRTVSLRLGEVEDVTMVTGNRVPLARPIVREI